METTGNLLGASSAGLFLHDAQSGACLAAVDWNLDHSSVQDYLNYFCSVDPLLDAGMRLSEGEIACGQELVPREEYLKSEHYNDFWQPQNLSDALTVFPIRNDHHSAHFTFFYPDESFYNRFLDWAFASSCHCESAEGGRSNRP